MTTNWFVNVSNYRYIQHISNIYPTWKSQLFLVKYSNLHIIWLYPRNFKGSLVGKLPSYGRLSWLAFPPSCQPHHHVNHITMSTTVRHSCCAGLQPVATKRIGTAMRSKAWVLLRRSWQAGLQLEVAKHIVTAVTAARKEELGRYRRASWEAGQSSSPNKWLLSEEVAQQRKVARPPVHSFIHLSIPSFIASWIHWFMDSMIHWFIGALIHWLIHWFTGIPSHHRFQLTWMICA